MFGSSAPPAAAPSGFSSSASPPAAVAAPASAMSFGNTNTAPTATSQANGGASVPAAASTPAAPPAMQQPPPPPEYAKLVDKACRDGSVSDAFAQEIKKRFGAPMEVKIAPVSGAAGTTAPGAAQALATAQQVGSQWRAAAAPQASLTGASSAIAAPPGKSTLARTTEAQQQQERHLLQVENAQRLLQLLLMCDSGYNNTEAPPADNVASSQWTETNEESVTGLHAAVGAIAASAASNLIAFVKASVVKHTQALDGESNATTTGLFGDSRRKRTNEDPTLLAAQCLYLLSRHFQLTASVVKEALELIDALYALLKNSLRSRIVALTSLSESSDTCALNTLMWMCVFSVVNMSAVWKKLRTASGELGLNELIRSSVASSIETSVNGLRKKLRESVHGATATSAGAGVGVLYGGGGSARASSASIMQPAVYTWQVVMDSYLSILTLAEGCLLRAKGSEQGFDKALDAFLGERVASTSSSSSSAPPFSPANIAVHRGKVTKRMVELAPVPRTLAIPVGLLYIAPYEMMSYLFDEMLPLLRHLSELEVGTHRRYVEQLEELPRISSAARGGAYHMSNARRTMDGDGDDGWLRRTTRVGLYGEVAGEPFTSEMAHLLEALAICLQHLPPEVLNPDLDTDCAATFFIFKNFVKHMRQVFATQRGGEGGSASSSSSSAVWENYTLKLMTKFMEVLAMIGRNPQYTQRVVVLLTDAQTECGEMQWHSLVGQALECAGFNSGLLSVPGMSGGGSGVSPSAMAAAAAAQGSSLSSSSAALQSGTEANDAYAASATLTMSDGAPRAVHRQFTRQYTHKCQRQFISSFFLLLRQVFAHPTLRSEVSAYVTLELALTFLLAPHQSQVMLGSTLSLISALITSASDAQVVWEFLEERQLLRQASMGTQGGPMDGAAALYDRFTNTSGVTGGAAPVRTPLTHVETLSLIGHCQYECTQGTYDITIGFLNLITALFQHDHPSMAALGAYTTVTNFIAQEIVRGVLKRAFTYQHERYTVFALAAAALRQALLVHFHGENGRSTVLPFANVMAINKAPADVVGEVVKLVLEASDAPCELLSHHRAAVRQALQLLITSIQAMQEQKIELLLFDTRTTLNTDLAVRILGLCSLQDTLLTKATLQLLLLFPFETANQAAHYWSGLTTKYAPVLESFAQLLHPLSTVPVVVQAPPELAQLDFDPAELVPGWPSALLIDTKSLLLDLLMRHAEVTEPSLTAWMCGFYHEEYSAHDRRSHASSGVNACGEASWWRATLLTSVVEGACSGDVERAHPALAVKCVKLLYLLRANRLYGALVVRPFLETVCQTLFLRLQHFRASQCTPVALNKYAYVLKLLALEACHTFRTSPGDLRLAQNTSIAPISVEVLLSLLHPFGGGADGDPASPANAETSVPGAALRSSRFAVDSFAEDDHNPTNDHGGYSDDTRDGKQPGDDATIVSRDAAVDITSWLPQALQVLPAFPEKLPAVSGGRSHLVPCAADGVVQYNMASLYAAFQVEQTRSNKPPLSMAELREKLRPFIAANDCFFSYAAGVSFVEGWCQLVSVACSVVQGLSMSRLRAFALCILRGLDSTTTITAAAQEQVCTRLCHCLSTVMVHLRQASGKAADRLSWAAAHAADAPCITENQDACGIRPGEMRGGASLFGASAAGGLQLSAYEASMPDGGASRLTGNGDTVGRGSGTHASAIGQRRPRDDGAAYYGVAGRSSAVSRTSGNNIFSTQAGEASNFYSAEQRSQLARSLLQQRSQTQRVGVLDAVSANAVLLQPLVRALVQWGARIASIRAELYVSLISLAETPGINLDDVVLWRSQKALLSVICADICSGCTATPISGVSAAASGNLIGGPGGSQHATAGVGAPVRVTPTVNALSPQMQHAVALLVALLQASAPIRDDFCSPNTSGGDAMSASALRCTTTLLHSVDHTICGFFANNGCPLGSLLWHIRSTFDVLTVVTLGHASRILHSDLLRSCFSMQAWKYSTQVVLGYSQASTAHEQIPNKPLVEQNKEVLRQLLLGVVRWVNLLLSCLGDAAPLLYEVQKFIRDNRSLIDYVFISPAAVSSTLPGSARLTASHLTLCAELSDCLRAMSSSVLAVDCRTLVDSMALPDLLNMLSSEEVWRRGSTDLYDFADAEGGSGFGIGAGAAHFSGGEAAAAGIRGSDDGAVRGGEAGSALAKRVGGAAAAMSMAERGRDVVAVTVRNLSHLLLTAEYGLRGTEMDVTGQGSSATPMLRFSASKRTLCIQIVRHVARSLGESAAATAPEFRLECYLYALHALVCLVHSFVLPIAQDPSLQQTPDDFMRYLQELPLQDLIDALMQSHDAVYQLKRFNTDYRGGLQIRRISARSWTAGVNSGNVDNDDAAAQSLSNGMRASFATDGESSHSPQALSTPKSGPAGNSADAFSIPSTPGLLPAADARRSGRDPAAPHGAPQQSLGASRASPRQVTHPHAVTFTNGGPSATAHADAAAAGHARDPNLTVVQNLSGTQERILPVSRSGASSAGAAMFAQTGETKSVLPTTENGEKIRRDNSLWDLLPSQTSDSEDWTRVYNSFQNSGGLENGVDLAGTRNTSLQWSDVLNVENEVRQVKIAIANALRATKGAVEMVRKLR